MAMPAYSATPTDQDSTVKIPTHLPSPGRKGCAFANPRATDWLATAQMNHEPLVRDKIGLPSRVINTCQGSTYPKINHSTAAKRTSGIARPAYPECKSLTAKTPVPATTVKYAKAKIGRASCRERARSAREREKCK